MHCSIAINKEESEEKNGLLPFRSFDHFHQSGCNCQPHFLLNSNLQMEYKWILLSELFTYLYVECYCMGVSFFKGMQRDECMEIL